MCSSGHEKGKKRLHYMFLMEKPYWGGERSRIPKMLIRILVITHLLHARVELC